MLIDREKLKNEYAKLTAKYEGYIQLSDRRIEHVWSKATKLPDWDTLHNGVNYILEMALYDPDSKRSILVRQHNNDFLLLDRVLDDKMPIESFITVTPDTPKMQIAQIWESTENEFCNDWEVEEAKLLMFAGFERKKDLS